MDQRVTGFGDQIPAVFVDFSVVGLATTFRTWLAADQRRVLHDGQEITVYGDGVDAMRARVLHVDPAGPEVEIEILDAAED